MEKGSKLKPYYRCVGNKMVNGKQYTLVWYVEDNKVLYMEAKVVYYLIDDLKNISES